MEKYTNLKLPYILCDIFRVPANDQTPSAI